MFRSAVASLLAPSASYGSWDDERWWTSSGNLSSTGLSVNPETAIKISAFFACLRVLGETVLSAPLTVYRRLPNGDREPAPEHPLYPILHGDDVNEDQTSVEWRETHTVHTAMRGTSYSRLRAGGRGPITHLDYIAPDDIKPERLPSGILRYQVREQGQWRNVNADEIFRLPGLGFNGVTGQSVLEAARESLGISLALQNYAGGSFRHGVRNSGVLEYPGKFQNIEAANRLRSQWSEVYAGSANAGKTIILEEGMVYKGVSMTNADAQMLDSEQWQVADIARWFRMPLIMIQEHEKNTSWGTGIEQQMIGFLTFTALPWLVRWERRINKELIAPLGGEYYCEHNLENLLRGDTASRFAAYNIAAGGNAPWMSRNEIRKRENLNKGPSELDEFLQPMNMVPAGQEPQQRGIVGKTPAAVEAPVDPRMRGYASHLAAQLVNKETTAMKRMATRHADDGEAWAGEVRTFYEGMAEQLSRDCYIAPDVARAFTDAARDRWLGDGVQGIEAAQSQRTEALLALMLEAE